MNRTRKIVAAGVGVAVMVAVIAIMLLAPGLHTQTPVSAAPPGTGGGSNGGGGTSTGGGPGSGNNTLPSCNQTAIDSGGDGPNETDLASPISQPQVGNATGGDGGSQCGGLASDPDANGDAHSNDHQGHQDLQDMLTQDALALAPIVSMAATALWNGVVSLGGLLVQPLAGCASAAAVSGPSL